MKKQLAFCINSLVIGGAEILLVDLINNWPDKYDLHLILLQEKHNLIDLLNSKNRVRLFTLKNDQPLIVKLRAIRGYFRRQKIDICFSHLEKPNKLCLLSALLTRTKVFPVIHSINIYEKSTIQSRIVAGIIYRTLAPQVICISHTVKDYCTKGLGIKEERIVQINNGIDFKRIRKYQTNVEYGKGLNFAILGRLEYVKGYDILLETLSKERIKGLNWQLKIIGDGSEANNLMLKTISSSISKKVKFLGAQKYPFAYLNDVHFLVMPSRREGLPLSLIEALGFGIPVIGSKVGIIPQIIKDGYNGFVFDKENIDMLADIILKCFDLSQQNHQEMSSNAKKSVDQFSIDRCLGGYLKLLEC